jgi:hypothetical protein
MPWDAAACLIAMATLSNVVLMLVPTAVSHADDHDRNERGDQATFDGRGAGFVMPKTLCDCPPVQVTRGRICGSPIAFATPGGYFRLTVLRSGAESRHHHGH